MKIKCFFIFISVVIAMPDFCQSINDNPSIISTREEKGNSEAIKLHLKDGKKYLKENKIFFAQKEFLEVLKIDKKNKTAEKYLDKINKKVREMNEFIFSLGKEFYDKEKYEDALAHFKNILIIDPENKVVISHILKCEEKIKEKNSQKQAEIIQGYWLNANAEYDKGNIAETLEFLNKILLLDTSNQAAIEEIRKVNGWLSDSNYEKAEELAEKQSFIESMELAMKSLEQNPENKRTKKLMEKLKLEAENYYNMGFNEFTAGKMETAIELWGNALVLDPHHKKTIRALERYGKIK